MIERCTSEPHPAVSHKEILKKLETLADPAESKKLYGSESRIEMTCEA